MASRFVPTPGLVPERPHHHAGVVLVPLDHAGHRAPAAARASGDRRWDCPPSRSVRTRGSPGRTRPRPAGRTRRTDRGSADAAGSGWCAPRSGGWRFMASTSARITSRLTARPRRESNSWRLTPRNCTREPLSSSSPSWISTRRNPTRTLDGLARADHPRPVQPGRLRRPRLDRACGDRERVRADVCEYAEFGDLEPGGPVVAARAAPAPGPAGCRHRCPRRSRRPARRPRSRRRGGAGG